MVHVDELIGMRVLYIAIHRISALQRGVRQCIRFIANGCIAIRERDQ